MKIIQITDNHLGTPDERIGGLSPVDRLKACIDDIESNHSDAAFCVFTGDITDAGKPGAYQAFSEILETLTPPKILIIGNHDHREHMCLAFPEIPRDENGFVQRCLRRDEGDFLFLDTLDQGHHTGLYCEPRRRWLSNRLEEAGERPVYLFMHHPPFDVGLPSLDAVGLQDKEAFAGILSGHKNIRHLFFGHVHRPIAGSWNGIPFTTLNGTNHAVAFDFSAPGYVPYSHEPPTYAVIFIDDSRVLVHIHDYLNQTKIVLNNDGDRVFALTGKKI